MDAVRARELPDGKVLIPGVIESNRTSSSTPSSLRSASPLCAAGRPRELLAARIAATHWSDRPRSIRRGLCEVRRHGEGARIATREILAVMY